MYILIAIFSYWFATVTGIPQYISGVLFNFGIKKSYHGSFIPIRLKPFDCEKCLAFWLALTYAITELNVITAILIAGCTSFCAYLLMVIVNKLK